MHQATLSFRPTGTARVLRQYRPVETQAAPRVHTHDFNLLHLALLLGFIVLAAPFVLVAVSIILGGTEPITVLAAYVLG